jgi:predicted transcriptional regulator
MARGGRREGAGEKPLDEQARIKLSAAISADLATLLAAAAGISGRSQSMLINDAIAAYSETLEAIASGAPVEQSITSPDRGGFRPGSGRKADEAAEVAVPDDVLAKLDQAAARTGRPRSSLMAGALRISGHWLDTVGLPTIEPAPAHVIDLWRGAAEGGGASPPNLPVAIEARYRSMRQNSTAPAPDVHVVRDYLSGAWAVGEACDGTLTWRRLRSGEVQI